MVLLLFIILITSASAVMAYITINETTAKRIVFLKHDDVAYKHTKRGECVAWVSIITVLSCGCAVRLFVNVSDVINIVKICIIQLCLIGAGSVDYRERRIPNFFPLVLSVTGIILLALGFFSGQYGASAYVVSSIFATVCTMFAALILSFLTKHGIGAGDVKLLVSLAIIGGVHLMLGIVAISVLLCALFALGALILKKKTIKDSVPFGPFILAGYFATILLGLY